MELYGTMLSVPSIQTRVLQKKLPLSMSYFQAFLLQNSGHRLVILPAGLGILAPHISWASVSLSVRWG